MYLYRDVLRIVRVNKERRQPDKGCLESCSESGKNGGGGMRMRLGMGVTVP